MTKSANLGFPRIGSRRELKKAEESYWRGDITAQELFETARDIRAANWKLQQDAGVDIIPSGDFSLYDQMLDMSAILGAVPERFGWQDREIGLETYFAMARGTDTAKAMEMTKWFDTNYHYIVPEFSADQSFSLSCQRLVMEYLEARSLGIETRPVLIGPITYLSLGKSRDGQLDLDTLLEAVLPVYVELLDQLKAAGAPSVQIDEPILVTDLTETQRQAFLRAYNRLGTLDLDIMVATYFGALDGNLDLIPGLPISGLHVDLVRAPEQLEDVLKAIGRDKYLSLGLIDGRNIWRADLSIAASLGERVRQVLGDDRLQIAPSCSLLHAPVDLDFETRLDDELKSWLAFGKQKLTETVALAQWLNGDDEASLAEFAASRKAHQSRRTSMRIHDDVVKTRVRQVQDSDLCRDLPYSARIQAQRERFELPAFPTTTIGSFPQTQDIRLARAAFKRGDLKEDQYLNFLKANTEIAIRRQEAIGLDVLVHGEFERNDMVEYFGEKLSGFAFTRNGWVQSYGSRCVKPPIIFGDVSRPESMTVEWTKFAQSLTEKTVKGMLTGPITILQWSFVRDDQPRSQTAKQIALAIRDEVADLEKAGVGMIQIDEPALREGLPLRTSDWESYLSWAVDSFRLASACVGNETQIHTHMCYCEFNDIMPSIAALDADVISIETSRSEMELLQAFDEFEYPNDIGPGVWDIHAPRIPSCEEMTDLLRKAVQVVAPERVWVNPDCGLKTRGWAEVESSLKNLVSAAKHLRAEIAADREPVGAVG